MKPNPWRREEIVVTTSLKGVLSLKIGLTIMLLLILASPDHSLLGAEVSTPKPENMLDWTELCAIKNGDSYLKKQEYNTYFKINLIIALSSFLHMVLYL